jgi:glycosyltransferase involved in cell wall biosynthesis
VRPGREARLIPPAGPGVLLVTPEPLSLRMAGPAIRCLELGRALAGSGRVGPVVVASLTAADLVDHAVDVVLAGDAAVLRRLVSAAGSVVVQGDVLGLHPWLVDVDVPVVVDAYDPFHLEQLEQGRALGEARRRGVVRDAVRALDVQLARADFVLCASERQRAMWIGHLAALGRVNPVTYDATSDLSGLIAIVPFGAPDRPARPGDRRAVSDAVPGLGPDDRIVLWGGGIYDWFDPETVIRAVGRLAATRPTLKLLFLGTRHPAQGGVGAATVERARAVAEELGLLDTVVFFHHGWVPHAERDLWMSSAEIAVSAHRVHLETEFSFRTRIVDYLWCGLPVVTTVGDELAGRVATTGAGVAVGPGDVEAYTAALAALLDDDALRAGARTAASGLAAEMAWSRVVAPLAAFCAAPHRAPDLVLGAGDRELLGVKVPRRTTASYAARVGATLKEGGARLVAERLLRRLAIGRTRA